jgi:hypothetical protein
MYPPIEKVTEKIDKAVESTESIIRPIRESFFKRFPALFMLLVTVGGSATFFGIERIISEIPWLNERPVLIFVSGIVILIITGRLYKKLG